jgi:hypothetical protein
VHAGFGAGGRRAATEEWSFLTKIFTRDLFLQYVGAGGLFCQKFTFCEELFW